MFLILDIFFNIYFKTAPNFTYWFAFFDDKLKHFFIKFVFKL